jgi:hypothetical protein
MNLVSWIACLALCAPGAGDYFSISVVDDGTGRGVPLVELRTTGQVSHWTDSAGQVAFYEPGLMNQSVYFTVGSHGYEYPADGFGFRGKALQTVPGGHAELRIKRINLAERLYRVTGEGIYRDTVLLGKPAPIAQPLLNAQVMGSDSVNTVLLGGQVYWFWGDTNRPAYPLGTFHVPGATSRLAAAGGLDPRRGVDLHYFTRDDGFVASTAEMPGDGPTWIDGLCVIDDRGRQRLFAKYVKVRKFLEVYERGLVEFVADRKRFEKVSTFDFAAPLYPLGHSLPHEQQGERFVYFGNPYPLVRVRATVAALANPREYEAFSCLRPGSSAERPAIDRDERGAVRWGWKRDTAPPTPQSQSQWLARGLLKASEAILALRDIETGKPVIAHSGSVCWNAHRRRFTMIVEQSQGTSPLGELWYAEAAAPTGPWVYARKIVTHNKYSFYNPKQHSMFDADGGRTIYFEGTYSTFFSGNDHPTPRYDYNQVMYSLNLDDPRVALPVEIVEPTREGETPRLASAGKSEPGIAFMALDRAGEQTVAIRRSRGVGARESLSVAAQTAAQPNRDDEAIAFYALPADTPRAAATTVALFAWRHADGRVRYAVEGQTAPAGFERDAKPLCRVWRYPLTAGIH